MTERVPKTVEIAYKPPIGYAEGDIVRLGPGDFWELRAIHMDRRSRRWRLFADLEPLEPGQVLNGFGEYVQDPVALEVVSDG